MIITFYSNYFNHHQMALCEALNELPNVEFYFVETQPMEQFRKDMGWGVNSLPAYVISAYESEEKKQLALQLADISDAAIIGSAPEWYIQRRLARNLLTFRYTERPMKEGIIKMFIPRLFLKFYRLHFKNRKKNMYVLGASAYASYDYSLLHSYKGKCLKFGYFPKGEERSIDELLSLKSKKGEKLRLLWSGRLLKLKRADLLIEALKGLEREYDYELKFVAEGDEADRLKALVDRYNLGSNISFTGFVGPDEIRELMAKSDIYIMTSNFLEGWGSVIYEALSEGCAVIASHACGCTPWLVKNDETGLVFKSGSVESLRKCLIRLMSSEELRKKLSKQAHKQMQTLWNPQVAAARIAEFTDKMKVNERIHYEEGPLSDAPILKNGWFK